MKRTITQFIVCMFILGLAVSFVMNSTASAQYWQAIPPYNLLWPLWPQSLNYTSPWTGNSTPLVSWLDSNTLLPVQPAWVWNYNLDYPWFLFNAPTSLGGNLYYWDMWSGFHPFPQAGTVNASISLPWFYQYSSPSFSNFSLSATLANISYALSFLGYTGATPYTSLLSPLQLWGNPPFSGLTLPSPYTPVYSSLTPTLAAPTATPLLAAPTGISVYGAATGFTATPTVTGPAATPFLAAISPTTTAPAATPLAPAPTTFAPVATPFISTLY